MAIPALTYFPQSITSGDTVRVTLSLGNAPATSYTATLVLNTVGSSSVPVTGSASGSAFAFVITAATSAAMAAGPWTWAVRATETASGDVTTAAAGDFTVLPNFATTITKSAAHQQLDAANTAMLTLVANPDAVTEFNGQKFTKENMSALLGVIRNLQAMVAAENATAAGLRGDAPTRSMRPYFR